MYQCISAVVHLILAFTFGMLRELSKTIQTNFGLVAEAQLTEEQLEELLAARVLELIERNAEQLFAVLYRLDVNEAKVHAAMANSSEMPANIAIARLIIARQKQKIETRMRYSKDQEGDGSW